MTATACAPPAFAPDAQLALRVDSDLDGHDSIASGGDDCDDTNPSVYTGAPELCDALANDCGGSWSTSDERGIATFFPRSGNPPEDWTARVGGGTLLHPTQTFTQRNGTLAVCQGEWFLHLRSNSDWFEMEGPHGPTKTVLDGGLNAFGGQIFLHEQPEAHVELSGLTFRHGTPRVGDLGAPAVKVESDGATVHVEDSVFHGNGRDGQGLYVWDADLTVADSVFLDHSAARGAALLFGEGTLRVSDSRFDSNLGGGLEAVAALGVVVDGMTAVGNGGSAVGSPALKITDSGITRVRRSHFSHNLSGAISVSNRSGPEDSGDVFVSEVDIVDNTNESNNSPIGIVADRVWLSDVNCARNTGAYHGCLLASGTTEVHLERMHCVNNIGVEMGCGELASDHAIRILDSVVHGNEGWFIAGFDLEGAVGGGPAPGVPTTVTVERSRFNNNVGSYFGALFLSLTDLYIYDSEIAGNFAPSVSGIRPYSEEYVYLEDTRVHHNTGGPAFNEGELDCVSVDDPLAGFWSNDAGHLSAVQPRYNMSSQGCNFGVGPYDNANTDVTFTGGDGIGEYGFNAHFVCDIDSCQ